MEAATASSVPVHSEALALALLDAAVTGELGPFRGGEPLSASAWAALREEPLYRTLRRIRYWTGLGVLSVQREQKRAGRPIRFYGLSARRFFIPRELLPPAEVVARVSEPLERQARADVARALNHLPGVGGTQILLERESYGAFLAAAAETPPGNPGEAILLDRWATLRLTHFEAREFEHELGALFDRYQHRKGPQSYSFHVRLVASSGC